MSYVRHRETMGNAGHSQRRTQLLVREKLGGQLGGNLGGQDFRLDTGIILPFTFSRSGLLKLGTVGRVQRFLVLWADLTHRLDAVTVVHGPDLILGAA
jgi:hypothetical protein